MVSVLRQYGDSVVVTFYSENVSSSDSDIQSLYDIHGNLKVKPIRDFKSESIARTVRTIRHLVSCNDFSHFCTLTVSKNSVGDRYSYSNVCSYTASSLKSVKRVYSDFSYLLVPELHDDGAYHFHGFCNIPKPLFKKDFVMCGHYTLFGRQRVKFRSDTFLRRLGRNDFHKMSKLSSKALNYVLKYVYKSYDNLDVKKRYLYSRNLSRCDLKLDFDYSASGHLFNTLYDSRIPYKDYGFAYVYSMPLYVFKQIATTSLIGSSCPSLRASMIPFLNISSACSSSLSQCGNRSVENVTQLTYL